MKKSIKVGVSLTLFGCMFIGGILFVNLNMKKEMQVQKIVDKNSIDIAKIIEYKKQIDNETKTIESVYNELTSKYGKHNYYTSVDYSEGIITSIEKEEKLDNNILTYSTKSGDKLSIEVTPDELLIKNKEDFINKKVKIIELFSLLEGTKANIHNLIKVS